MPEQADRPVAAEVVGQPSPTDGITVAAGTVGSPRTVIRIEYPMAMVDPSSLALLRTLIERERAQRVAY